MQEEQPAMREMRIASTDGFDVFGPSANGSKGRASVHVIPPRTKAPKQIQPYQNGHLSLSDENSRAEIKAAKAELALTRQESEQRSIELAESEKKLR